LTILSDQTGLGMPRQFAQPGVHLDQRLADELDPAVGAGQGVQDLGVKDKGHMHPLAVLQGLVQGRMVTHAQVTSQPDKAAGKRGCHQSLPGWIQHCTHGPVPRNGAAKIGA